LAERASSAGRRGDITSCCDAHFEVEIFLNP
jgi:hypothetical protein